LQACTPALPNGTLITTCGSMVAEIAPLADHPSTSRRQHLGADRALDDLQIRFVMSRGSPGSFAMSDGLVVTPSIESRWRSRFRCP